MKEFLRKNKLSISSGAILGAITMWEYLDEKKRQTQIWNYNSHPPQPLDWDKLVRILTNPLMKAGAGGIVNHFYDWIDLEDRDSYSQNWLTEVDDDFYKRFQGSIGIPQHALAHSRLGVQTVYTLRLNPESISDNLGVSFNNAEELK
ncbi:MAG: hypothetical protein AABY22_05115, partial [Nanoarchaeota archaeon]